MNRTYQVRTAAGNLLGIFPVAEIQAVKALVQANPGAEVSAHVSIDNPCAEHPAFEAHYCLPCGTARSI